MAIRIAPLDDNLDFPEPVRQRQAERLRDAGTPEGAAVAARVDSAVGIEVTARRGSAVPEVQGGYLFVTDTVSGKRKQVTSGAQVLGGEPTTLGEGVVATIDGARKWVSPSGYPRPLSTDFSKASGWGSSTMSRLGEDIQAMFAKRNTTYHHTAGAVGGFQISHIAAAVGVRPLLAKAFTIPAGTTPVTITPTNLTEGNNTAVAVAWTGTFAGVPGLIQSYQNSSVWTFTRNTAGVAKEVPEGTPYIPARSAEYQAGVTILNPGKNTLSALSAEWTVEKVIELTEQMYDYFAGAGRQVLVLGHFVDTGKPANSITRGPIQQFNSHMKARYGGRFVDISAYLTGSQVWTDTGITPTAIDIAEQALGNKPPSLSGDSGGVPGADVQHLSQAADLAVTRLIEAKLEDLGWLNVPPPINQLTTISDDFNRPDGELGVTSIGGQEWKPTGGSSVMAKVAGQKMVNTESTLRRSMITPPSGSNNYEVSARIAGLGATPADRNMQIILRGTTWGDNIYLSVRQHNTGDGASFWRMVGEVPTLIGAANTTVKAAVGQVWKARVEGNSLKAYVDGVEVLNIPDAAIPPTGSVGLALGGGSSSACAWDDFSVTKI